MKENIATIPLMNAFNAKDECPFCFLEREAEQHAISFNLGSAYMEDDIREKTDATGFCRHHFKMMYDYGNRLGNALILSTHLRKLNQELGEELKSFTPGKSNFLKRIKHTDATADAEKKTPLATWLPKRPQTATSAIISGRSTGAIWIHFSICTRRMRNSARFSRRAKASACRISAI